MQPVQTPSELEWFCWLKEQQIIVGDCKLNLQKFFALAAFMEANVNISSTGLMVPELGNPIRWNLDLIKTRKNCVEEVLPATIYNC